MNPLDITLHLLYFFAPAAALALVLALGGQIFIKNPAPGLSWWAQAAIVFVVGCAVLVAGLWFLGRDGKMATYTALVLATASCQWVLVRGWRG